MGADTVIESSDDVAARLIAENGKKADVVLLCAAAEEAWNRHGDVWTKAEDCVVCCSRTGQKVVIPLMISG